MRSSTILLLLLHLMLLPFGYAEERPALKVGMLLPLSGAYASVGADTRRGIEHAVKEINAPGLLELIYADSRAEPAQAVSEFKKLTDIDNVSAVYAFRGPVGMSVSPLAKSLRLPLLGGVGNKHFARDNEYAFQIWPRSDQEGIFFVEKLAAAKTTRVAILTAEDDWTVAVTDSVRTYASSHNVKIAFDQPVPPADVDFRTLIAKIKQSKPEAVFVNIALAQIAPFVRQFRTMDKSLPLYSNFWAAKPEVLAAGGEDMSGVMFIEMKTDLPHLPPGTSGATLSAYVGTHLMAQTAAALPENFAPSRIYETLMQQRAVKTRSGVFPIKDRCVEFPLTMRVIRQGKIENL